MIDTLKGAQVTVEKIKQFVASPVGVFLYAYITGAIGIVLLLGFSSMIWSSTALTTILPAIIAFNCAAGGYSLIDKNKSATVPKIALILLAALLTITGCCIIVVFCPWESLLDMNRYLISASAAIIFTIFGAWIAWKSKNLNRS
ncbi:MAG: hypothetical protein ACI8PB_000737 [Desulforhopalus sp.]|jgi:hypothetical protein